MREAWTRDYSCQYDHSKSESIQGLKEVGVIKIMGPQPSRQFREESQSQQGEQTTWQVHIGLVEGICVGGADRGEDVGGSKEWLMRCSESGNFCFQQPTQTPKFFSDNLIPGISQGLIKALLECVTEFLTHRLGRCLQILQRRLGKGMIKTQELGSS